MRIWFNRGFSLAPIAKAMIAANPSLEVIISVQEGAAIKEGPTATWFEPTCDDETYYEWACEQILENDIDVFVPTRRRRLFEGYVPCKVHLPATQTNLEMIEDKYVFAKTMLGQDFHLETLSACSSEDLRAQLIKWATRNPGKIPCVKPRYGVNGHGFWKLTHGSALSHLMNPDDREIRQDLYLQAIEAVEKTGSMQPIVLMEYLPGPEVSFDVLAHEGKILKYIARTKLGSIQHLQSTHPLEEAAATLTAAYDLHGLVNIQFRKARSGAWKVLEINARPAGGCIYSEEFGGGLIGDWGALLAGHVRPEQITRPTIDVQIEMVSTPVRVPQGRPL